MTHKVDIDFQPSHYSLEMSNVTIGASNKITSLFDYGQMGLGFGRFKWGKNFFEQMVAEGKVKEPIFTLFLDKVGGLLTLGGFDDKNCQPTIHWVPKRNGTWSWEFMVDGVSVNKNERATGRYFYSSNKGGFLMGGENNLDSLIQAAPTSPSVPRSSTPSSPI